MTKFEVESYISSKVPTRGVTKAFAQEILDAFAGDITYKVRLKFVFRFSRVNASVLVNKRKKTATLSCNRFNLVRKRGSSAGMKYFKLCAAILHELEHLRILSQSDNDRLPMTILPYEQIVDSTDDFLTKAVRTFLSRWSLGFSEKLHMSSSTELHCMNESHRVARDLFAGVLTDEDAVRVDEICDAVALMEQCCEIKYATATWPVYKFAYLFIKLQKRIMRKPALIDKHPALRWFFLPEGQMRSIDELCSEAVENKDSYYGQVILRFFMEGQPDIEERIRSDRAFFEKMEHLSNRYCQQCVDFVKNKRLCMKLFDKDMVEDNVAMLVKNYRKLEKQMAKVGMSQSVGSIIPLYSVR